MKRTLIAAIAAVLLLPAAAMAQQTEGAVLPGNVANRSSLAGCIYESPVPTAVDGQQMAVVCGPNGQLYVQTVSSAGLGLSVLPNNSDTLPATSTVNRPQMLSMGYLYNGTTFERARSITDPATSGVGVTAVAIAPQSSAGGAINPVAASAVASSLVVKASAGNLYEWRVTAGASAGYVMLFNATTAPADGAVTPIDCVALAANASVGVTYNMPERYSTGIVVVFSTTGCFTKTASATAFIRAAAQ